MEEKKLLDRNKLIAYFEEQCGIAKSDPEKESLYVLAALKCCIDLFQNFPTVDAVEVVRCKDCKYLKYQDEDDDRGDCDIHDTWFTRTPESFCCYGERRDGLSL